MRPEVRRLRKAQRVMEQNVYPGYPFQLSAVVDMKTKQVWMNLRERPVTIDKLLQELGSAVAYQGLGCNKATKGSWLIDTKMEEPQAYIDAEYDDFYFDNLEVIKLYYALNAAIRSGLETDDVIFACCDLDCEYVECKSFKGEEKMSEINQFVSDYFEGC